MLTYQKKVHFKILSDKTPNRSTKKDQVLTNNKDVRISKTKDVDIPMSTILYQSSIKHNVLS